MLRPARALDCVGHPFDPAGFTAVDAEHTYAQFLERARLRPHGIRGLLAW
jgi:hypothetical protein